MPVSKFEEVWVPVSSETFIGFLGLWSGEQGKSPGVSAEGLRGSPVLAGQDQEKETCWSLGTKTRRLNLWVTHSPPKPKH